MYAIMKSCLLRLLGIIIKPNKPQPHQMRMSYLLCVASFLFTVSPTAISALYMYTYRGYNYTEIFGDTYDTSMFLRGELVLESALESNLTSTPINPILFSFFDGVNTLNEANTRIN